MSFEMDIEHLGWIEEYTTGRIILLGIRVSISEYLFEFENQFAFWNTFEICRNSATISRPSFAQKGHKHYPGHPFQELLKSPAAFLIQREQTTNHERHA